ncbi:unnamed protein product [Schistosoma mattheei]|uniref:Uncharacterized protein n=1 Tax=Schistosoma mattheei TaxID=31246 RepID=A0A183PUA9_9TREM|nr:unnamed protein product [Schistosoma mattheei]
MPSKTKSSHHHHQQQQHHNNYHQKQRNSPSPKKSIINKLSPSEIDRNKLQNSHYITNLSPKLSLEQKLIKTTEIIPSTIENILPSLTTTTTSSGIPMPRQLNLYQQSNMNSHHMSSSSSSSSSKIKESPTKMERVPYINYPIQNQSTLDNHSINNTTCHMNMNSIDNTYQTTNIQPHRSHSINSISTSTIQPLMSSYLHDTRRYMTGNSIFEQRTNQQQQQHVQPTQQTHQSHHQTIPLQSNSHIIKTGIPYSNDTNIICSTVNQSIPIGLPPPPPPIPLTQYTQIHNHPSNNNAVISRRVRIQEPNQAQNVSNHQSMHSVQQVNKTSLVTKTRQEMNATTTTTSSSSNSTPSNLTYKYLPNISSQTPNGK